MTKSIFRADLLDGKVALVTGGGSGICMGIARAMMAHGARTAIVGRKADRLASSSKELSDATGRECLPVTCDVRDVEQVVAAVEATLAKFGRLDVVVNGAAGNFLAPAAQLSPKGFRTVMEIDALGTYQVSKIAFDKVLRDHGGVILNISATLHYGATPLQVHASAAKAAVDSVTRTLGLEWGSLGIRVVGIAPGPIDETEGMTRLMPPGMREKAERAIPLRRFGRIDEIATLAVFLVSDGASLITGETVVADGGAWLAGRTLGLEMG